MEKDQILNDLKTIIEPYVQNKEQWESLHDETDFIKDLEINSANLVDIVLDVEDAYDIEIDDQSMEKMLTVKASLEIIQEKIAQK